MVFFKAQKLQRLADLLQRVQGEIERAGGESESRVEEGLAEAAGRAGLDLEVARIADLPTLERVLASSPGKCWVVAEVLFLDGLRARSRGRSDEARALLEKARALYGHVGEGIDLPDGAPSPGERMRRIEELKGS